MMNMDSMQSRNERFPISNFEKKRRQTEAPNLTAIDQIYLDKLTNFMLNLVEIGFDFILIDFKEPIFPF